MNKNKIFRFPNPPSTRKNARHYDRARALTKLDRYLQESIGARDNTSQDLNKSTGRVVLDEFKRHRIHLDGHGFAINNGFEPGPSRRAPKRRYTRRPKSMSATMNLETGSLSATLNNGPYTRLFLNSRDVGNDRVISFSTNGDTEELLDNIEVKESAKGLEISYENIVGTDSSNETWAWSLGKTSPGRANFQDGPDSHSGISFWNSQNDRLQTARELVYHLTDSDNSEQDLNPLPGIVVLPEVEFRGKSAQGHLHYDVETKKSLEASVGDGVKEFLHVQETAQGQRFTLFPESLFGRGPYSATVFTIKDDESIDLSYQSVSLRDVRE